jgi:hypothetical protein
MFYYCPNLAGVFFTGNAPSIGVSPFTGTPGATVYYLPGTTGWNSTFGGRPAVLWNPQPQPQDATFGVLSNQFGFNITGSRDLVVVVEGCTNLAQPRWFPVATNTLANGTSYFRHPEWTNSAACFYRLRAP